MNGRIVPLRPDRQIRAEAAAWIARLDSESMPAAELQALRAWVERGPEYREALEAMAAAWDRLDVLEACRPSVRHADTARFRSRWLGFAIAAGLVGLAVAIWVYTVPVQEAGSPATSAMVSADTAYETPIGVQESVSLPDGSSVRLNTNSRIEVAFSSTVRRVRLTRGEGYFEVERDPGRPFVVETRRGTVTALGTAFSVRVDNRAVEVTVQHGRVQVARKAPAARTAAGAEPAVEDLATLDAGQSVVFDESQNEINVLEPDQLVRQLAWRDGMLIFEGDPLEDVIAEVSRYDDVEIVISDPELRGRRIGGYFRAGETDVLLAALEGSFGVDVERVSDRLIYLYPADP